MSQGTLIFAPESWMSAEVCEALPGLRSALDQLRRTLDVTIFRWPCTSGRAAEAPGWRGVVQAMANTIEIEATTRAKPVTVLTMQDASGLGAAAIAVKAEHVEHFISASIDFTALMLRSMGMVALLEFFKSAARTREIAEQGSHARRFLSYGMDGASEEELTQAAAHVDATIEWECWDAFFESYDEEFDLSAVSPLPVLPTLYLDSPSSVYAAGEKRSTFLKFFPHAQVAELKDWPNRLQDASTGHEVAEKVLAFLRR